MPDIDPILMRKKQTIRYVAPDGLSIPAYLTLPSDAKGPFPTIVLVHGGPWVRDGWDWDPEVQLLAARGYAVLQPQFRGSSGFGKQFVMAGTEQWGLAMQDDVTAGAQWLVAQGIADPARMCIYGASYGGYAAMWAMAKTPTLFRCGISYAGVSDLNFMFDDGSDVNDSARGRELRQRLIGDPEKNRQKFDQVSPVKQAAAFLAPVLISHGNRDKRVPIEHSEKLVEALREHHKEVEWLELIGEGHGIGKLENQERFFKAVFEFLDKHIGAAAITGTTPAANAATAPQTMSNAPQ